MPLVRVRTFLGCRRLGEPTRPYASEVTVKAVVDRAIEPLEGGKAPAQAHSCVLA